MSGPGSGEDGKTYSYANEFLFFIMEPDKDRGNDSYMYCSGVDLFRFIPITKGRHGLASNPAMRGLQLVNLDVRDMALLKGAVVKPVKEDCAGLAPTSGGWYSERLLIENVPESFPGEVIEYAVVNLVKKIFRACTMPDAAPETLLRPDEVQALIEGLCVKYEGRPDLLENRRPRKQ